MSLREIDDMPNPRQRSARKSYQRDWQTWTDPRDERSEKDFEKWRKKHKELVLLRTKAEVEALSNNIANDTPLALMAARTGLSPATVTKYLRKADVGKRGPLLSTYLAMKAIREDD